MIHAKTRSKRLIIAALAILLAWPALIFLSPFFASLVPSDEYASLGNGAHTEAFIPIILVTSLLPPVISALLILLSVLKRNQKLPSHK
jgi:hypothetical protein